MMTPMTPAPTKTPVTFMMEMIKVLNTAGYAVISHRCDLQIYKDDVRVGQLECTDVRNAYRDGALTGSVSFIPAARKYGRENNIGRYKIVAGTINISTLLARLKAELPKAQEASVKAQAREATRREDDAIRASLLGTDHEYAPLPPHVRDCGVYNGKVIMKLSDLTPEQAAAILAILK